MTKNSITDGKKELELLYDLGLRKANGGKRFIDKKEKLFLQIWQDYNKSYRSIANELYIGHPTVRTYACEIFRKVESVIGEPVNQQTMKSAIKYFLDKSPEVDSFKGVLISEETETVIKRLRSNLQETIKKIIETKGLSSEDSNIADLINKIINDLNSSEDSEDSN